MFNNNTIFNILDSFVMNCSAFGIDEYNCNTLEYSECYAKQLIILRNLYDFNKDLKYLDQAKKILETIINSGIENERSICWGLPYEWHGNSINDGFLITTCFCIDGISRWTDLFEGYNEYIKKAINWCFALLFYDDNLEEYAFFYAPKIKKNIYNATSIAFGIISKFNNLFTQENKNKLASVMMGIHKALKNGYWNYSQDIPEVDLLHQSYTIEGLEIAAIRCDNYNIQMVLLKDIEKSISFISKKNVFRKRKIHIWF